jgi:two-component system sensor histidine kinase YesM
MKNNIIISNLKNISLNKKLYLAIILLVIIPLTIAALIINVKTTEFLREKTNTIVFETLKKTHFSIYEIIHGVDELSLRVMSDNNLQDLLKLYENGDISEVSSPLSLNNLDTPERLLNIYYHYLNNSDFDEEVNKYGFATAILPYYKAMPFINSISVSKNGNTICQMGDILYTEDSSYFPLAKEIDGRGYWTPVYELNNRSAGGDAKNVISLIRMIKDLYNSDFLGMERISIEEKTLHDAYANINTWPNSQVYILNSEGSIISSTNKSMLNQSIEEDVYDKINQYGDEGYFKGSSNGESVWYFYYQLKQYNWIVLQKIPTNQLNIQLKAINLIIILSILFCLFFGILFSLLLRFWVIKPLMQLSKEMEKVKTGDFNVKVKALSHDEIGSVITQFNDMTQKVKTLIDEVYTSQIKEREAELVAMQAQINPHFLYNTLDNIRWTALEEGADKAGEQIEILSNLFRHILNEGREITTIGEEIKHLQYYVSIQKFRFKENLQVYIDIDENLKKYQTMKLILQPLVENSIEHGFQKKLGQGIIYVRIEKIDDIIKFTVRDNGIGNDEKLINDFLHNPKEESKVFALKNIKERIQLRYGNEYGLKFYSKIHEYTIVEVTFPATLASEEKA